MDGNLNIQALLRGLTPQMGATSVKSEELPPLTLEKTAEPAANKNRCGACQKKLKLTDLSCRCTLRFCAQHRAPEEHACTFDFKSAGRAHLEKQLEKAVADKVQRI